MIAYLDESSIQDVTDIGFKDLRFIAWYTDQDGGELGYAEFDTREDIPATYDAEALKR